jgi:hypothetical protein
MSEERVSVTSPQRTLGSDLEMRPPGLGHALAKAAVEARQQR